MRTKIISCALFASNKTLEEHCIHIKKGMLHVVLVLGAANKRFMTNGCDVFGGQIAVPELST